MKPTQVFHPYQLHRDQLKIVSEYNLVCVGSPSSKGVELARDRFNCSFYFGNGETAFRDSFPRTQFGDTLEFTYFCPIDEAKRRGLKWKRVPLTAPRKPTSAERLKALEEENKTLRETLAKIAGLVGEAK